MRTEFTYDELNNYFENLSPGETGMISIEIKMAIDYLLERHFEENGTISLFELVAFVAQDHSEHMDELLKNQIEEGV